MDGEERQPAGGDQTLSFSFTTGQSYQQRLSYWGAAGLICDVTRPKDAPAFDPNERTIRIPWSVENIRPLIRFLQKVVVVAERADGDPSRAQRALNR